MDSPFCYKSNHSAQGDRKEETALVFVNFSDQAGTIQVPFPDAGIWQEMIDQQGSLTVSDAGAVQTVEVPSHYGMVFILQG